MIRLADAIKLSKSCNCSLVQFVAKLFCYDPHVLWGSRKSMFFALWFTSAVLNAPSLLAMNILIILTDLSVNNAAWFPACCEFHFQKNSLLWYMAESPHSFIFILHERRRSPKPKTWHHLIKITLPLVDELRRERGIVVPRQIESTSRQQLYQIRKQTEPVTEKHNRQTERRDKTGGLRVSIHRSDQDQFIRARWRKKGERKNRLPLLISFLFCVFPLNEQEERRVVYVGRLRSNCTRTELKCRFEVFGEIEECAVNLRDDG